MNRQKREVTHKFERIKYIFQCLKDYGLHEGIQKRPVSIFARYSILIENLIRIREFSKAIRTAQIEINDIIKDEFKKKTGKELDRVSLMRQAFKEKEPAFVLTNDLSSDNGKSIQDGYMQLFAGSMRAFRNPNAHKNLSTDLKDAIEKLIIASHLLKKFENRFK